MSANQVRQRRRQTARARQAARRRQRDRRRRLGIAAVLAVLLAAGILAAIASRSGPAPTGSGALAGLQTGPAPWAANTAPIPSSYRFPPGL